MLGIRGCPAGAAPAFRGASQKARFRQSTDACGSDATARWLILCSCVGRLRRGGAVGAGACRWLAAPGVAVPATGWRPQLLPGKTLDSQALRNPFSGCYFAVKRLPFWVVDSSRMAARVLRLQVLRPAACQHDPCIVKRELASAAANAADMRAPEHWATGHAVQRATVQSALASERSHACLCRSLMTLSRCMR